ncbi:Protein TDO-2 a [Aphelenchoides avenae]|nr:Protein TDO-2 a [Aphelenchus avenae]
MACPMGYGVRFKGGDTSEDETPVHEVNAQDGVNKAALGDGVSYRDYLQLDKLLTSQVLRSDFVGQQAVPDEHLFIITHQTYELWFKQIIYDIDHVRNLLMNEFVDETKTLQIVSLLERTVRILRLLADQMLILETMSPLDFVEFRKYLTSASGFQSLQFRLLENKLGVISAHRVKYNAQHYREVFEKDDDKQTLSSSENEPSLFILIDRWLSRTPGIFEEVENNTLDTVVDGDSDVEECEDLEGSLQKIEELEDRQRKTIKKGRESFWNRYLAAVRRFLSDMKADAESTQHSEAERAQLQAEYLKTKRSFDTITDEKQYLKESMNGERRLSHNALKGALMIYFYRDMPRFSQPYQILTFLMDIDSLLQKWRYNHVMLVQRMLGSKQGTGGSSGYLYLRTTVSDRYKVFLDLFNLSTWLIPRAYIPKLSPKMVKTLSEHSNLNQYSKPTM